MKMVLFIMVERENFVPKEKILSLEIVITNISPWVRLILPLEILLKMKNYGFSIS
jgi:hypothetical protein